MVKNIILKLKNIQYGVRGKSFMDEDTYVQGWIYNQQGTLVEQHGYPREGF